MTRRDRKKKRPQQPKSPPREDRRAEVTTVAWMLSVFATLLASVVAGVLAIIVQAAGDEAPDAVRLLPGLLILVASISGMVGLTLVYPTYRFRKLAPPWTVTIFAVVICIVPLAVIVSLSLRG